MKKTNKKQNLKDLQKKINGLNLEDPDTLESLQEDYEFLYWEDEKPKKKTNKEDTK